MNEWMNDRVCNWLNEWMIERVCDWINEWMKERVCEVPIMLSVKQGGIKYHFLGLWYDSNWDWTLVSWTIDEHCLIIGKLNYSYSGYDTKLYLIVRLQSWSLGNVEYPFITITLRSTLTWYGSTFRAPSTGKIELFNHLLRLNISYLKHTATCTLFGIFNK